MADILKGTIVKQLGGGDGSVNVTCDGDNRFLMVFMVNAARRGVTMQYDGVGMVQIQAGIAGGIAEVALYTLENPSSGENLLSWASDPDLTSYAIIAQPLSNVKPADPVDAKDISNGGNNVSSVSDSLTSTTDDSQMYFFLGVGTSAVNVVANANETILASIQDSPYDAYFSENDTKKSPAGANTMGFSWSNNNPTGWASIFINHDDSIPAIPAKGSPIFF